VKKLLPSFWIIVALWLCLQTVVLPIAGAQEGTAYLDRFGSSIKESALLRNGKDKVQASDVVFIETNDTIRAFLFPPSCESSATRQGDHFPG
jgi:hypothetical protein